MLLGLVNLLERIEGVLGLVQGPRPRGAWRSMRARRAIRARGRTAAACASAAARHPGNLALQSSPLFLLFSVHRTRDQNLTYSLFIQSCADKLDRELLQTVGRLPS